MFRPHLEHKHTEPQPFPFEQRYQGKVRRQELVQKELVKEQQELAQVGWVQGWHRWVGYRAGTGGVGTGLAQVGWVQGWHRWGGYRAGTGGVGTGLAQVGWVQGWHRWGGYRAGTGGVGTGLAQVGWVQGWHRWGGYRAGTGGVGTGLAQVGWVQGWHRWGGYRAGTGGVGTGLAQVGWVQGYSDDYFRSVLHFFATCCQSNAHCLVPFCPSCLPFRSASSRHRLFQTSSPLQIDLPL